MFVYINIYVYIYIHTYIYTYLYKFIILRICRENVLPLYRIVQSSYACVRTAFDLHYKVGQGDRHADCQAG